MILGKSNVFQICMYTLYVMLKPILYRRVTDGKFLALVMKMKMVLKIGISNSNKRWFLYICKKIQMEIFPLPT